MSTKYNVIFGVTKDEKALEEAISKVITEDIWPNCINVKTMANYGMGDKAWFIPPDVESARRRRPRRRTTSRRRRTTASDLPALAAAGSTVTVGAGVEPAPTICPVCARDGSASPHRRSAQALRQPRGAVGRLPGCGARREGLDHRPQRLRQDHAAALHQLSGEADRRPHLHRRQADRREAGQWRLRPSQRPRAGQGAAGDRLRLPALQPVSASDRARQRHHRAAEGAGPVARGGRGARSRDARPRSASATRSTNIPSASPAASSSASPSPACSPCSRSSCCSTRPPPPSIPS